MYSLELVKQKVEALLNDLGYSLYSFKYTRGLLEVVVDRDESISMNDIVDISQKISDLLDENEFCEESYNLSIYSLGAEKPLDLSKLEKYVGKYVALHLSNPYKGKNNLEGEIKEVDEEFLYLNVREKSKTLTYKLIKKDIDKGNLTIKF